MLEIEGTQKHHLSQPPCSVWRKGNKILERRGTCPKSGPKWPRRAETQTPVSQGRVGLVASFWTPAPETGFLIHIESFAFQSLPDPAEPCPRCVGPRGQLGYPSVAPGMTEAQEGGSSLLLLLLLVFTDADKQSPSTLASLNPPPCVMCLEILLTWGRRAAPRHDSRGTIRILEHANTPPPPPAPELCTEFVALCGAALGKRQAGKIWVLHCSDGELHPSALFFSCCSSIPFSWH